MRGTPKVNVGNTLEVIRFSPEGEVKLAPDLNVTFSQPMVAVTSQEQAAQTVPVQLSPSVEGKWRWLGTKTLMFDTTKRFPMATKYTARVPAGTQSANGQTLQKDFIWTFTTPPPKVEQMIPRKSNRPARRADVYSFRSGNKSGSGFKNNFGFGTRQKTSDSSGDRRRNRQRFEHFVLHKRLTAESLARISRNKFRRFDGKRAAARFGELR